MSGSAIQPVQTSLTVPLDARARIPDQASCGAPSANKLSPQVSESTTTTSKELTSPAEHQNAPLDFNPQRLLKVLMMRLDLFDVNTVSHLLKTYIPRSTDRTLAEQWDYAHAAIRLAVDHPNSGASIENAMLVVRMLVESLCMRMGSPEAPSFEERKNYFISGRSGKEWPADSELGVWESHGGYQTVLPFIGLKGLSREKVNQFNLPPIFLIAELFIAARGFNRS
jgi:hypothetical protein